MNKQPIFLAAPFFFIRTSSWSNEDFEQILAEDNWVDGLLRLYDTNEQLREALLIASPSLYSSLQKRPLKDPEFTAMSLFRYAIRMATRSTPFGLFSFIMNGQWGRETKGFFDSDSVCKMARPDMEWVFSFVQKLYRDEKRFWLLPIQTNPLVSFEGGRCKLSYLRTCEKINGKTVSVRITPLTEAIFRIAKKPLSVASLWEALQREIPSLEKEKTERLLRTLLEQQLLIAALLPSLLSKSPFKNLLPPSLEADLRSYENLPPGKGEIALLQLQGKMRALAFAEHPIQVDASYPHQTQQLTEKVAQELQEALSLLWKISSRINPAAVLQKYLNKFIEKYGTYRTVPLLELFSESRGLGPFFKDSSPLPPSSKFTAKWEQWLHSQWQQCLACQKEEIVIEEQTVNELFRQVEESPRDPVHALPSLDVFCKLFAKSSEALDRGEFSLGFSQSNWQGGASAGRFLHLFSIEMQTLLSNYFRREEQLEPHCLFAELSYWPFSVRLANVAIQPCLRLYHLDIEERKKTTSSLSLKDIYVGATQDRFYFTLKEGGCELIFRTGNFLNPDFSPPVLQFLRDASLFRSSLLSTFSWGNSFSHATFLPRVRFQKTILSPAQWRLSLTHEHPQNLRAFFSTWAEQWNLPFRFFLVHEDQSLLFDRRHPACLSEILRRLKKERSLQFIEEIESFWMQSKRGSHSCEIVVPFLKNPLYVKTKPSFPIHPYFPPSFGARWKLPGSDWLFVCFYLPEELMYDFLIHYLPPLAEELQQQAESKEWFFVRYHHPESHIRFRLRLSFTESVFSTLKERAKEWMEKGTIQNYTLASYEREIERYGGLHCMEAAEKVFHADSIGSIFLLQSLFNRQSKSLLPMLQALSVVSFLKDFGFSAEEILASLNEPNRALLGGFREHKQKLLSLLKSLFEETSAFEEILVLKEVSQFRSPVMQSYRALLEDTNSERHVSIYKSMVHMHSNRLGCDLASEKRAIAYAHHALTCLQRSRHFNA